LVLATEANELTTLAANNVAALRTNPLPSMTTQQLADGNQLAERGRYNKNTCSPQRRRVRRERQALVDELKRAA
jgi:hypothetical protein